MDGRAVYFGVQLMQLSWANYDPHGAIEDLVVDGFQQIDWYVCGYKQIMAYTGNEQIRCATRDEAKAWVEAQWVMEAPS
jgi:hypothetical protein